MKKTKKEKKWKLNKKNLMMKIWLYCVVINIILVIVV